MRAEHTSGPWKRRGSGRQIEIVSSVGGRCICRLPPPRGSWLQTGNTQAIAEADAANADLIVAAPKMLDYLEWVARRIEIENNTILNEYLPGLHSLIAEATGAKEAKVEEPNGGTT